MIGLEAKRDMSKSELFDNIIQNNLEEELQAFVKQNDIDILSEFTHKDLFTFAKCIISKCGKLGQTQESITSFYKMIKKIIETF